MRFPLAVLLAFLMRVPEIPAAHPVGPTVLAPGEADTLRAAR